MWVKAISLPPSSHTLQIFCFHCWSVFHKIFCCLQSVQFDLPWELIYLNLSKKFKGWTLTKQFKADKNIYLWVTSVHRESWRSWRKACFKLSIIDLLQWKKTIFAAFFSHCLLKWYFQYCRSIESMASSQVGLMGAAALIPSGQAKVVGHFLCTASRRTVHRGQTTIGSGLLHYTGLQPLSPSNQHSLFSCLNAVYLWIALCKATWNTWPKPDSFQVSSDSPLSQTQPLHHQLFIRLFYLDKIFQKLHHFFSCS